MTNIIRKCEHTGIKAVLSSGSLVDSRTVNKVPRIYPDTYSTT
jgi:hypothetical protein